MAVDFNIEVRKKQLESLDQYLNFSKNKVQSILDKLGWSAKILLEDKEPIMINCSINPTHRIPFKTAEEHLKKCSIRIAGYDKDEQFLSEPLNETASTSTIKLDYQQKVEILSHARWCNPHFQPAWNGHEPDPMTSNRLTCTYSADERLALYDFCVTNTEKPPDPPEYNVDLDEKPPEGKELTYEERLARERDAKRRRIKYKSVHTNRKSHTEIMKELIENQMEVYVDWLDSKQNSEKNAVKKREEIERPHSSTSKHSAHSGDSRKKYESERRNGSLERRNSHRPYDKRRRDDSRDRRRRNYRERSDSSHRSRSSHHRNRSHDRRRR